MFFLGVATVAVAIALFAEELGNVVWRLSAYPLDESVGNVVPMDLNELRKHIKGKRALVVGGTKGIGAGTAVALARAGAASVVLVGRSRPEAVLARLTEVGDGGAEFAWEQADLGSVKGCLGLVERIVSRPKKTPSLDFLVMTVGAWPNWSDRLSEDGVDKVLALDIVARYVVATRLAPLLAPGARVMSVLASTTKVPHPAPEEMKRILQGSLAGPEQWKARVLPAVMGTAATLGDVLLEQLAARYPDLVWIGTNPGAVKTDLLKPTFPTFVSAAVDVLAAGLDGFYQTEEASGEVHAQILVSHNAEARRGRGRSVFFNHLLEARGAAPLKDDAEFGKWLTQFLEGLVGEQAGGKGRGGEGRGGEGRWREGVEQGGARR